MPDDEVPPSSSGQIAGSSSQRQAVAAVQLAQRELDTCMAAFGEQHLNTANAINRVGCIYHQHGDIANAIACYEHACRIFERAEDSHEQRQLFCMTLCNLGEALCQAGYGARAASILHRAQAIAQAHGTDPRLTGAILGHLGWAADLQGDLREAEALLQAAIDMVRSIPGTDAQISDMQVRLADVQKHLGDQWTTMN